MLKKTLIVLFVIFSFICVFQISFASSAANSVKSTINSGTNTVVDGVQNLAEDVRNGFGKVENGIEDALTMNTNKAMTQNTTPSIGSQTNSTYNATRTADMITNTQADTTTMWVWLIVAIAAVVIVALVWFYGSQNHID